MLRDLLSSNLRQTNPGQQQQNTFDFFGSESWTNQTCFYGPANPGNTGDLRHTHTYLPAGSETPQTTRPP